MKTIAFIISFLLIAVFTPELSAQKVSKWQEVSIKVSSQCGMCKERIEKILAFEKGIKSAVVDLEKDEVSIVYNSKRTDVKSIRTAISKAGYDADDVAADPKAYEKLPGCCKKPDDPKKKDCAEE